MVTFHLTDHMMSATAPTWKGKVVLIAKPGGPNTGLGRYAHILHKGLLEAGVSTVRVAPTAPPFPIMGYSLLFRLGIDLRTFLIHYPVWMNYPRADIYHLASQNLAALLLYHRPKGKVIVTVHDIFPYMFRNDPRLCTYRSLADRWFDRMAMKGLDRADRIIATSQYTKQCVVNYLGLSPEKIQVVYPGIDHDHFQPLAVSMDIYERYGLARDRHYLIYVGSEDPRKNLTALVQALAIVRREEPDVEIIKVGRAHFDQERTLLIELAEQLGVRRAIHFLDDVPEADLPLLYNLSEIFVMPSLYEGFGFPLLEAMACGEPVIYANAGSLPELAGDAATPFNPGNVDALVNALHTLLGNESERLRLSRAGYDQASRFRWEHTVFETTWQYAIV